MANQSFRWPVRFTPHALLVFGREAVAGHVMKQAVLFRAAVETTGTVSAIAAKKKGPTHQRASYWLGHRLALFSASL
jgi:hypothetical protein